MMRGEIIISDSCNFHCPYCRGIRKDCQGEIPLSKIFKIINYWTPIENIRFSGGEPTLYPHLLEVVHYARRKGVKRIAISTNGSANLSFYQELIRSGANDFSISLDACCSSKGQEMAGVEGLWEKTIENIRALSKLTYVTVGMVFTPENLKQAKESVCFAHNLGVADIRIISSAQYNKALTELINIPENILKCHSILNYRVNNYKQGRNVRGIKGQDYYRCPLVLDDSAIVGDYHFPCIIYLREQGEPIGNIGPNMRRERHQWFLRHNTHKDIICKNNCLDVCVDYNNKFRDTRIAIKLKLMDSSYFDFAHWHSGLIHEILDGPCRDWHITSPLASERLRQHAVGWCRGDAVPCRPKGLDEVAVMFYKDSRHFWSHLRKYEFYEVFGRATPQTPPSEASNASDGEIRGRDGG